MVSLNVLLYQYADICVTALCMGLGFLRGVKIVNFSRGGFVSPTPNSQPGGQRTTIRLASHPLTYFTWVALPRAYTPASIGLRVIGAPRPPLHDEVVLEEEGVSQEKRSTFWEVTVFAILSKKCICTCVLFRTVSEIELFHCAVHCTLYRRATCRVFTRVAKCIGADGGIFKYVLYWVNCTIFCHLKNKYRY
jgi:hypothetical protein